MSGHFIVITGPTGSGKTDRLLLRYRAVLRQSGPGSVLWLAPTWRAAADMRELLLGGMLKGVFAPNVVTFAQFAESILHQAPEPIRPISRLMKRHLVRLLIDQRAATDRLRHFGPIASTSGLLDLVCDFISELKRLEIWPDEFRRACQSRGLSRKDEELLELYEAYQACLVEHHLYDAEGRFWSARDRLRRGGGQGPGARGQGAEGQQVESGEWGVGSGSANHTADAERPSVLSSPDIPLPTPHFRLVVADGFTDFTRTQHEILETLAARAEDTLVSLPLEAEPRRSDLFNKPLKTLAELQRRHPHLSVEELPRRAATAWPAMMHLERTLFANPRQAQPAPDTAGLEILAAARQLGEIELIAARIKGLLTEGDRAGGDGAVRPGDIAVVFRHPQDTGRLVAEVFGRLGIPFAMEAGEPLRRSPALVALVTLLRLDVDDWPMQGLLAALGSNYFRPDWPEWLDGRAFARIEQTIRRMQVPQGRGRLMEELQIANCEVAKESPSGREVAGAVLARLAAALDELPQQATLAEWGRAWQGLARETGVQGPETRGQGPEGRGQRGGGRGEEGTEDQDQAAWRQLLEGVREGERLAQWLGQPAPPLDRRQALATLLDMLSSQQAGYRTEEAGRVRVLSVSSIRRLRIPYLFMAGLREKSFPSSEREDRLYSPTEYQRLIDEGLPLVNRHERNSEEMLLFYEAITSATRRLYLSYPALDESGQPLSPSPYLQEVEQACGPGRITRTERTDLYPVPADDEELFSIGQFRVKAVAAAIEGKADLLAGLLQQAGAPKKAGVVQPSRVIGNQVPLSLRERVGVRGTGDDAAPPTPASVSNVNPTAGSVSTAPHPLPLSQRERGENAADNLLSGLSLVVLRQDRKSFGPAEGMLLSEAARRRLAEKYSFERTFSATELEQYASCPYRFFLERVMRLEPVEDLALELDYLERGRLAHEVMATLHRRVNERQGRPASPAALDAEHYERLLSETLQEVLGGQAAHGVQGALREVNRRVLTRWMAEYRRQHESYDALWRECEVPLRPEFFEVSFGRAPGDEGPPSTDQPLELACQDQVIRISGRIDRIDTGQVAGHVVFNVLDYKTGGSARISPEAVARGTSLQLPLYALAVTDLILSDRDSVPWQAGYWYLSGDGFKPRQALKMYQRVDGSVEPCASWEEMRATLNRTVAGLVRGMREGQFPVWSADPHCTGYCPFSTVCRINQIRPLEKTWQPPGEDV